jgi:outer membrane protein OmpA-like peptidoglycan-associated protein
VNDAVLSGALALCLGGGAIDLVALNLIALPAALAPLASEQERTPRVHAALSPSRAVPQSSSAVGAARRMVDPPAVLISEGRAPRAEPKPVAVLEFELSSRRVQRRESRILLETAARLRDAPEITVVGHADASGSDELNDRLSAQRAAAVAQRLIEGGIPKARVRLAARGEREPRKDGNSRRVEIFVGGQL